MIFPLRQKYEHFSSTNQSTNKNLKLYSHTNNHMLKNGFHASSHIMDAKRPTFVGHSDTFFKTKFSRIFETK